jgi:hypothetical protein
MNKESRDMAEIAGYAQLATRAADLADRCEARRDVIACCVGNKTESLRSF